MKWKSKHTNGPYLDAWPWAEEHWPKQTASAPAESAAWSAGAASAVSAGCGCWWRVMRCCLYPRSLSSAEPGASGSAAAVHWGNVTTARAVSDAAPGDIELSHSFNTHPSTSITECTSVLWSYFTFLLGISLRRLGVSSGLAKSHLFCPDICVCFIFPLLPWGMHTFYYLTFIFPRGWLCIWLFCFLFPHVPKGVYEYHYLISTLLLYSEMHKYWLILFHLSSITVVWNDVSLWKSSLYWVCM